MLASSSDHFFSRAYCDIRAILLYLSAVSYTWYLVVLIARSSLFTVFAKQDSQFSFCWVLGADCVIVAGVLGWLSD